MEAENKKIICEDDDSRDSVEIIENPKEDVSIYIYNNMPRCGGSEIKIICNILGYM